MAKTKTRSKNSSSVVARCSSYSEVWRRNLFNVPVASGRASACRHPSRARLAPVRTRRRSTEQFELPRQSAGAVPAVDPDAGKREGLRYSAEPELRGGGPEVPGGANGLDGRCVVASGRVAEEVGGDAEPLADRLA